MNTEPDQFPNRIQRTSQLTQEDIIELSGLTKAERIAQGYEGEPKPLSKKSEATLKKWAGGNIEPPF